MSDENLPAADGEGGQGGGPSERLDNGLRAIEDGKLTNRAIARGWVKARWPIDENIDDMRERFQGKGQTLRDIALIAARRLAASENPRAQGIGIRSILTMEGQNQADEHRSEALAPPSGPEGATETIDQIRKQMLETMPGCRPADTKPEA